jgi:hypothetical protein
VVEFALPVSALAIVDSANRWTVEPGIFELSLGTSSRGGLAGTIEVVDAARVATRGVANR